MIEMIESTIPEPWIRVTTMLAAISDTPYSHAEINDDGHLVLVERPCKRPTATIDSSQLAHAFAGACKAVMGERPAHHGHLLPGLRRREGGHASKHQGEHCASPDIL